ncbi:hypothetical protein QVD17_06748 [Tagetes erecta]|uniref:Sieve element occlusion N-terminal domain-containing protein n=1 Tax=Tagetes erecta TaxID=13708 RepID=A0AAD8PC25_TARER|nr:hypothetical protein QVD17_06748 [Tagetes erecta]
MDPFSNSARQQLLGMAYSLMPHKQPMGLKSNPMVDPLLTSRQPAIIGPVQNSTMQQLNLSERSSIFIAPDDSVIRQQVLDTHFPDGTEVDVKPLMQMVEELLRDITINAEPNSLVTQPDVVQLEDIFHKY